MSDARWHMLLRDIVARRIDEAAFQDRFLEFWRAGQGAGDRVLSANYALCYVVEARCPDSALRDSVNAYEVDGAG